MSEDDTGLHENKKYYTSSLRYKTYYVGDPRNEIRVTWYIYYEIDKDENDGDSLLYCIEDKLCETDYNIHEMVKNANTYIDKLDTIVPVTCYIKKSKKSELRKIVDELNREIN